MTFKKKNIHAAEQDRPDVAAARKALRKEQLILDPKQLVFIDETAATTKMTRLYGRALQGKRLVDKVPHGHWKTTTFICGLHYDGVTAPFVLDGPMDGPHFLAWQRQQEVRRIYLDVPHSINPKPSWFGESVGHYENGELVVDTIGFLDRHEFDFVDNWRTPHSKDMHVVERFRLIDGGKGVEATVTVDDPGTFNQPWSGTVRWQRVDRGPLLESICAENNEAFEKYF